MDPRKLLIVDDDEATGLLFKRVGEREGYGVRAVTRATEAKEAVVSDAPDVIILDMVMPDMDGIEMVGWLTGQGFQGRVILVSGFAEAYLQAASTMARAKGIADVAVLTKPVALDDLRRALAG